MHSVEAFKEMAITFTYLPDFLRRTLDEADIARCESDIGAALPLDLRAFLLANDGPVPTPGWIALRVDGTTRWLGPMHSFMSVMGPPDHRSRGNSIEAATYSSREMERVPRHLISFGTLMTQPSTLLISVATADHGVVYAWHPRSTKEGVAARFHVDHIVRVAGSFSEFLALLTEPPSVVTETYRHWLSEKLAARGTGRHIAEPSYGL